MAELLDELLEGSSVVKTVSSLGQGPPPSLQVYMKRMRYGVSGSRPLIHHIIPVGPPGTRSPGGIVLGETATQASAGSQKICNWASVALGICDDVGCSTVTPVLVISMISGSGPLQGHSPPLLLDSPEPEDDSLLLSPLLLLGSSLDSLLSLSLDRLLLLCEELISLESLLVPLLGEEPLLVLDSLLVLLSLLVALLEKELLSDELPSLLLLLCVDWLLVEETLLSEVLLAEEVELSEVPLELLPRLEELSELELLPGQPSTSVVSSWATQGGESPVKAVTWMGDGKGQGTSASVPVLSSLKTTVAVLAGEDVS